MAWARLPSTTTGRAALPASGAELFRFGCFEVDPKSGEIRKNGIRVHLPSQPLRILSMLLEQPGQVITREELRRELWPDGDPADFDRSLNTAVNRLRAALCDSVDNARYIQTLPRRGYRFLASVERLYPALREAAPADAEVGSQVPPESDRASAPSSRWWVHGLAGGLGVLVVTAIMWLSMRMATPPPANATLLDLTDYPGAETTPSWSPDGTQIAFSWTGGKGRNLDIFVLKVGASTPTRLTQSLGDEFSPRYSPDGRQIAFYRRAGDSAYIHVISSDQRNLTHFAGYGLNVGPEGPFSSQSPDAAVPDLASLSWSPDAKVIAYADKSAPGDPYSIFFLSVSAREGQKITWPPAGIRGDGAPAFSPDGRLLAFVRSQTDASEDIYIGSVSGGDLRRLTTDNCRISGITWSRDGRSLIFSSERSGEPNLWRVPISGGTPQRLAPVRETAVLPAIPANRDGLVFVRWSPREQIVRVPLAASHESSTDAIPVERLRGEATNPRFSPDGTRIAFSSASRGGSEIWVSDPSGQNAFRLTSPDEYSASPRWSPDGRYIAFDSRARNNWGVYDLYVISVAGGEPHALTAGPVQNSRPSWSSDGRWIYFGSDRSGTLQIWKTPTAGGPARQVTRHGGSEAEESADGSRLYYSRRAVPGLWSVPVDGGEEVLVLKDLQWENSRNWTVTAEGIYFLYQEGERLSDRRYSLKLYRFRDKHVEQVASLGGNAISNRGCSISPNRRWLLYVQEEKSETDLAIVKGFR